MGRKIDFSALVDPITPAQLREHLANNPRPFEPPNPGLAVLAAVVLIASYAVVLVPMILGGASAGFSYIGIIVLIVATLSAPLLFIMSRGASMRTVESHYRYHHFARANGFTFAPWVAVRDYPATIFTIGGLQDMTDCIRSSSGRRLDIGNFPYAGSIEATSRTTQRGYMAMRLDRKLPHMILDSKANNSLLSAATGYVGDFPNVIRNQRLSLEGDFDKHFTLYCPKEYERDALYVFTPDLMALLIDNAAPFDVEIVDDWMFVYSARPFTAWDHETYRRLFGIVDTVGTKTLSQTARYSDTRADDPSENLIAAPGQRLSKKLQVDVGALGAIVPGIALVIIIVGKVADAVSR